MKNKRKYDNPPPTLASEVTQKNLSKLRKLAKADDPKVTEIKTKASDFLSDRKNSNCLVDLIGYLELSEPGSSCSAAIQAIKRIVTALIQKNQLKRPSDTNEEESTELKYRRWLWERIEEAMRRIAELMFHRKSSVSHLAVVTLMNILQIQNFSIEKPKAWDQEGLKILNSIVLSFCSNKNSSKVPLGRFQEYFEYGDVCYHFLSTLSRVVSKVTKKKKSTPMFVDNVINFLEMFPMPDEDKFKGLARFIPVSDEAGSLSHDQLRKHYGTVWTSLVTCTFNVDQYKRSLIMLNEKVIPLLPRPVLLTDFLLGCFSVGGAISMLALSGVFTLMTKYNLDYPDFYKKLYELFRVEIFHVKYRARFFHLSDLFLASTHLPEAMVASFVKRLARISLQAPAECLPMCIRFIHNLIHRHRGLEVLIDAPAEKASDLTTDPFLASEVDPSNTKALESSLWEIKTLTSHLLPEVSSAAKDLIEKGIREQEKDISGLLENTISDFMDLEMKKKVFVNVPLNWEAPEGLKFAKNNFLSEIFEFS